ncbi:hypothetical protein OAJ75_00675 [Candidatus Pelagibacter sp.]|nr:hypothetical protein [Candidatus Pelagibacter sp.]
MSKSFVKFFIAILLLILLINSNSIAFHKENSNPTSAKSKWDGNKETKKDFENKAKQEFCAFTAKGDFEIVQGDPVKNEDTGEIFFDEKQSPIIILKGSHSNKAKKVNNLLIPNLVSMNLNADWQKVKLVEILKMFCLQDSSKDRPIKFKGSYLEEFYTQIAFDNRFLKTNSEEGDYNKKFLEGELGEEIMKRGIVINNPNAVWFVPDFLVEQEEANNKAEKKKAEKKRIAAEKEKKRVAREKGNEQWISENKQNYIDEFGKKLDEYENKITELTTKRNKLTTNVNDFEAYMFEAEEDSKNAIADLVNRDNQEIKNLRDELRDNIKTYLSPNDLKEYKDSLKKIDKVNFKKYKNYTTLKNLIKRANKSNKAANFVGTDGTKILGITFKQKKIGFIREFKNLENRELGSGSEEHEKKMDNLNSSIQKHEENIGEFVNNKVAEIKALDEELGQRVPLNLIIMGIVVVIIIIGVGVYLYFQRKEMDELKREAEEKVGSLKNEFEDKLKTTSDQIKSVSRSAARSKQTSSDPGAPEPIQEQPKTPEEIIAEKYDELVSDYKEALEDFSKVAGFKQKWHGLALSRKERQDGTKTILINSTRPFEKAEIWCVTFSEKYFAFPGSSVKSNMATYMNLDFEKAGRDFKGVFAVSSGSSYSTEPSVLRRGGAGFVVERIGKIIFPN